MAGLVPILPTAIELSLLAEAAKRLVSTERKIWKVFLLELDLVG
jgi:hypothetical protein